MAALSISSVAELVTALEKLRLADKPHAHVRHWFRGHSKTNWPLHPGVYRQSFGTFTSEQDRLEVERHLYQDFKVMSAGIRTGRESDADIYFLQQHYRMPTRLLDWTTSPLAALHFAAQEYPEDDGEFFLMDAYRLTDIGTSRHPKFQTALKTIVEWKGTLPNSIIAVRPDHFDRRVSLQRSCFTFHVSKQPVLIADCKTVRTLKIRGSKKNDILRQLSLLGIDYFSIYGDLEHLAKWLSEAYNVRT